MRLPGGSPGLLCVTHPFTHTPSLFEEFFFFGFLSHSFFDMTSPVLPNLSSLLPVVLTAAQSPAPLQSQAGQAAL